QRIQQFRWVEWSLIVLMLFAYMGLAARPGKVFDEGLYYTQFIRWTQEFGVVPGLGNLHTRLGFNSHWHLLQASVSWPGTVQHDLNAQLWVLLGFGAIFHLRRIRTRSRALFSRFWVLMMLLSPLWFNFLTAPTADYPLAVLTWLLIWLYLRRASLLLLTILAIWGLTIKLSGGLLLLIPLLAWWQKGSRRWQLIPSLIGVSTMLITPWMIRNIILHGYLIFHVPFSAVGVEWQVPAEVVAEERSAIKAWARLPGGKDWWLTADQPLIEWLPNWWRMQVPEQQAGILLSLILGIFSLGRSTLRRIQGIPFSKDALVIGILVLNWLFWFTQAPDPRFGLGAIWGIPLIFLAYWPKWDHRMGRQALHILMVGALLIMFRNVEKGLTHPIQSAPFHHPDTQIISVPGGSLHLSQDKRGCFDAALPCIHVRPDGIGFRGQSVQEGFIHQKKNPDP
ncbi:MAG: hypothetical protein AAFV07_15640, partial [Bacteroidota bacterium]